MWLTGRIARANVSTVSPAPALPRPDGLTALLEGSGHSLDQLPAAVGLVQKKPFQWEAWTLGVAIVRTAAWSQSTDGVVSSPLPSQYIALSADASFNRTTFALTLGREVGKKWRVGGGLLVDVLNLRSVQSLTFRDQTATYVRTFLDSYRATGSQVEVRVGLGGQIDLSKHIKFGAVLRTPGVRVPSSGTFTIDVVDQQGAASEQLYFFDSTNTTFRYNLPLEVGVVDPGRTGEMSRKSGRRPPTRRTTASPAPTGSFTSATPETGLQPSRRRPPFPGSPLRPARSSAWRWVVSSI